MKFSNKALIILFICIISVFFGFIDKVSADYQTAGVFVSTNILPSSGAELINNFSYTATVPANTALKVQFSYDGSIWYNSSGTNGGWDTLSTGTNTIDLSSRVWRASYFYYRMFFTSTDGVATASLDSITLSYNSYSGAYDTYNTTGSFTSTNLLSGQTATTISSFTYTILSLPTNTGATVQFSTDNSTWYNSSGASEGSNTLSAGTNTISLSGLSWSGSSFYYKMSLTSNGTYTPEIDSVTLNYSAPITFTSTQTGAFNIGTTWGGSCSSSCTSGTDFPGSTDNAIIAASTIVTLDSARTVSSLTVNSGGTFNLSGNSLTVSGTFSVTGELQLTGDETITGTPALNTGSAVTYTATSSSRAIKSWTYTNTALKINGSGGTFTLSGAETVTAFTVSAGTLSANSQTLVVTGLTTINGGTWQPSTAAQTLTGGLTFSSGTITQGTGAISIAGNMTISGTPTFTKNASGLIKFNAGNATQTLTSNSIGDIGNIQVSANSGNTTLTLQDALSADNITIDSSQTLDVSTNSYGVTCAGNWSNSGTFTPRSGTVTFNGTGAQSVTSGGQLFNTLTVTNAFVAGVTFADRLQTATLTDTTDASKLSFAAASAGSPHTISSALNLTGGASKITLAPSVATTTWYITAPTPTTATNVIVSYSNSTNHITPVTCTDGGNNVNWDFDITPPTGGSITLGGGATFWTTNTSPTIALTTDDASQYQLCLNSATAGNNCTSVARSWAVYTATPTAYDFTTDGIKTLYVQFKDAIENISATYSDSITIDASAPNAATALAWSETSPHNATSVTASWTKSNSADLANQKIQFYSDATCVTTSGSLIDLASNILETRALTGADGTTYAYKITSIDTGTNETVSACSSSMQIDTSAPTGTSISSIAADSSTQLTVVAATATDAGAGLHATPYQIQETTGNSGATSSDWQASATHIDSGLTPNTQYTYKVRAKDILDNTSEYSATSSKYTLADIPGTPTLSVDSSTQITVTLTTDLNPTGTYYYIENTTNSTNSDWTTDASWISSGLTCNTAYTFKVKAKNGDGTETAESTASATTSACPSEITGGGAGQSYLPPSPPLNGFQILINGGSSTTSSQNVTLNIRGSFNTPRMSISNDSNFTNATQESYDIVKQWRLSDGQGQKTVYLKFFSPYGVPSNTITATINYQIPSIITPIINIIIPPTPTTNPPEIPPIPPTTPPVEEVVLPEAPLSMQDIWNLLPTQAINQFVLSPVPQEISDLVQKFPELAKTLEAIGIAKITDISKLVDNNLALPNISQIVNPIGSNLEPGQIVVPDSTGSPSLTAGQLANLEGIPLENLTDLSKQKIPTDILFVKTSGGLVDYNTTLSLNEQGHPQQQLSTIVNQPMQLIVKADSPARAIRGYFIFKQNSMKSASKISASDLTASLLQQEIDINQVRESTGLKQALVLSTFDFTDPEKDNIWTADIVAPPVDGQYDIIVVIDYQDQRLQPKELTLVTVVDPEGYVYTQMTGGIKGRVPNAKVSIYWLNPVAESYELWPAKDYQQVNPQITDDTGKYSFLVPEGTYYLKVEAKGYSVYQGNIFEVKTGNGIHQNIELRTQNWWLQFFDWKVVILIIFGVLLVYNFYSDMKRRKQNNRA